ncbi:GNAT family N-acetyltransferase [Curtobacterium sp. ER1/6]|uniref:GNAT family N-acetyltransferase n=1 Tax=Curtobacterium sp. ER1/6 TaxID=1891920 RepID=UPI001CB97AA7|nr:GNAT family N-acetyltransferase [Curtobacterium sp. ER1/6]
MTARSFGARLDVSDADVDRLSALVSTIGDGIALRSLAEGDVDAVLRLDAATLGDYPGSLATRHDPLDRERATPSRTRRAFGALDEAGVLLAMTYVDVSGIAAETDFTVVRSAHRGRGIGVALKAFSVRVLAGEGVRRFRTGGSADNRAIIRANQRLGYVTDEEWVTLEPRA